MDLLAAIKREERKLEKELDDLGYFDLEEKTLQPLKNPFGPKL